MPLKHPPYIIGITGGSASGKTTFLNQLSRAFSSDQLCIISQDNYYKPLEKQIFDNNGIVNYDLPDCIDFDKFLMNLEQLINGKSIILKEYTFNNPGKTGEILTIHPAPVIIIEGLFIFYSTEIENKLNLKVFIDADEQIKFNRRIKRDTDERGISIELVTYQWNNHVKPAYEKYVLPYIQNTDIIILNNHGFSKGYDVLADHITRVLDDKVIIN